MLFWEKKQKGFLLTTHCCRGETGLFPEAYVQEVFEEDTPPPALAPPPLPQVGTIYFVSITFPFAQCGGSVSFWYGSGSRVGKNSLRIRFQTEFFKQIRIRAKWDSTDQDPGKKDSVPGKFEKQRSYPWFCAFIILTGNYPFSLNTVII